MKQENESTKELVKDIFSPDSFFEQAAQITKAHAYDILVPQLQEENEKLKRILHELTPGGSEFYNDPEYCAKWVRENREENHYQLSGQIKKLKERVKYLEELINEYTLKMKANLSGEKVDEFLKEQANDIPETLFKSLGEAFPLKP